MDNSTNLSTTEDEEKIYSSYEEKVTATSSTLFFLEDENGYYVEMGYYPTTYAGLVSDCSFTSTGETFTLGDGTEYDIYTDGTDEYIQYTPSLYSTSYTYSDGTTATSAISYYKLEPIQWQVLGVYTAGATTQQTSVSSLTEYTGQELGDDEQLAVQSRLGLESMVWDSVYTDSSIDYVDSDIYSWLGSFYTNVLSDYSSYIVGRTIDYNTTASNTSISDYYDNYTTEYLWLTSYTEADGKWYTSSTARLCSPSDFALATGAYLYTSPSYTTSYRSSGGTCFWWLRSSYVTSSSYVRAGRVSTFGSLDYAFVYLDYGCVRPAMLITLPVTIEVEYDSEEDCWFFEDGYMPQEYVGSTTPSGVDESAASEAYTVRLTSSSFAQVLVYAGTEADYALVTIGNVSGWFKLEPIRWIVCYGSTLDTSVTSAVTAQIVTAGFIYSNAGTSFSWAMSSVLGMSVETLEASLELTNAAVGEFSYDSFSGTLAQLAVNEDSTTLESKIAVSSTEELDALGGTYASTCTDFVAFLMSSGSNTIGGATEEYWTRDLVADLGTDSSYYASTGDTFTYPGQLNNGIYVTASGTLNNSKLSNRLGARLTMSLNGTVKDASGGDDKETTYSWMTSEFEFPNLMVTFGGGSGVNAEPSTTEFFVYIEDLDEVVFVTSESILSLIESGYIREGSYEISEDGSYILYLVAEDYSTVEIEVADENLVLCISYYTGGYTGGNLILATAEAANDAFDESGVEGYDIYEVAEVMEILVSEYSYNEGSRDTYSHLSDVFGYLNECYSTEDVGSYGLTIFDEDGFVIEIVDFGDSESRFEGWTAVSSDFLSVSLFPVEDLSVGVFDEVVGENFYNWTNSYYLQMSGQFSESGICYLNLNAELYVGTLGEDFDFENYNLAFVLYDPSTANFYVIPVTEDMFDTESQTLTMSLPCTGTGMFYYYPV